MSEPPRVIVLSADSGAGSDSAGHDRAADALAAGLRRRGLTADRYVLAGEPPGSAVVEAAVARAAGPDAAAVVSVSPLSSHVAGRLRARGTITAPVVSYLADAAVPPRAVAAGVDVHLTGTGDTARQARALGATDVRVVAPPVGEALVADLRRSPGGPLALVLPAAGTGPGTGAAVLAAALATARDVAATGAATPVIACGGDELLRRRIARSGAAEALHRTDDLAAALRSYDVVVQNGGGQATFEALAAGVAVVSFRCVPGPGRGNAAALEGAGLAPWIRHPDDLGDTLRRALDLPAPRADTAGPDAAETIAGLAGLVTAPGPLALRRLRPLRPGPGASAALPHTVVR